MRYFVTIGERTIEVDLSGDRPTVDGEPVDAELARLPGTPVRHLLADGASIGLVAKQAGDRGHWELHLDGHRFEDRKSTRLNSSHYRPSRLPSSA